MLRKLLLIFITGAGINCAGISPETETSIHYLGKRTVFRRNEGPAKLLWTVNSSEKAVDVTIGTFQGDQQYFPQDFPGLAAKGEKPASIEYVLQPGQLAEGEYTIKAEVKKDAEILDRVTIPVSIARRINPGRFPIGRWGSVNPGQEEEYRQYGINIAWMSSNAREDVERLYKMGIDPGSYGGWSGHTWRIENTPEQLSALLLSVRQAMERWSWIPVLADVLVYSEVGRGFPKLTDQYRAFMEKELGFKLPEGFSMSGRAQCSDTSVLYSASGIVPDDNKLYLAARWWWERGESWNVCIDKIAEEIEKARPGTITTHDPMHSAMNTGIPRYKSLKMLQDWSYTRDPKTMAACVKMMRGIRADSRQGISQIIGFCDSMSPPFDAPVSLAYLWRANWHILSQGADRIVYYDYIDKKHGLHAELPKINERIILPFGPLIKTLEEPQRPYALLRSSTSSLVKNDRYFGSSSYLAALFTANIPYDTVTEEDILSGRINSYKGLFLFDTPYIRESVYKKILAYAKSGKKIYVDHLFKPEIPEAIKLRITGEMPAYSLERLLKQALSPETDFSTDTEKVILAELVKGKAKYLFVIDDGKEGEDYKREIKIGMKGTGSLYDLLANRRVDIKGESERSFSFAMTEEGGKLFALYPREIKEIRLSLPPTIKRGEETAVTVEVIGDDGKRLDGNQPLQLTIINNQGEQSDYSACYAAEEGKFSLGFCPALNDAPGRWKIEVRELSSGLKNSKDFEVN